MNEIEQIKKYVSKENQEKSIKKYKEGYPLQYIIGNVDFHNYNFLVKEEVLIPRFETEYFVENLIKIIKENFEQKVNIADLGTGTGAIAITLNKELETPVTAFDISDKALELAKCNNKHNKSKVNFIKHDIMHKIPGKYDVLVSNPPYIDKNDIIEEKVYKYEPHLALFAENKGLIFYERIIKYSKEVLHKKNILAFEIGDTQKQAVVNIIKENYPSAKIITKKDLAGKDRMIFAINE